MNLKSLLIEKKGKGYIFESETDTEVIAKLIHHIHLKNPRDNFRQLVEKVNFLFS